MKPNRSMPPTYVPQRTKFVTRKHRDGTVELILCVTGGPIRCFGIDENEAFKRMAAHLRGY